MGKSASFEMKNKKTKSLILDKRGSFMRALGARLGRASLFAITAIPTVAIVFILFFIAKEALPFFENLKCAKEFFTSTQWSPSNDANPHFGALAIFYGTFMVTLGSCLVAVPLGILAAVCLNEILNPRYAGIFKPVAELLAAIPSVAYGFFALVVFSPILQNHGGALLCGLFLMCSIPLAIIFIAVFSETVAGNFFKKNSSRKIFKIVLSAILLALIYIISAKLLNVEISSGTNALNASIILAIMALPTIVSISQDALAAVGKDMREGSLALGATRFETIMKVVLPCAKSGISVAVILGFMRVMGETMVVWMASGNALKIPEPFYNFLEPVRTLTATIAGEMGEADQSTGSERYHVLFAMSLCLLLGGLLLNGAGAFISRKKKN